MTYVTHLESYNAAVKEAKLVVIRVDLADTEMFTTTSIEALPSIIEQIDEFEQTRGLFQLWLKEAKKLVFLPYNEVKKISITFS